MIENIFFGPFAVGMWMFAAVVMFVLAAWLWLIVLEVGGLRGSLTASLFTAIGVIFAGFALLLHPDPHISKTLVGMLITAACVPIPVLAFFLSDLYSADRNSHRSFTTKSYLWYKNLVHDAREEHDRRHPVSAER